MINRWRAARRWGDTASRKRWLGSCSSWPATTRASARAASTWWTAASLPARLQPPAPRPAASRHIGEACCLRGGRVARGDKLVALRVEPLDDHVANDGLRVLGDLHVVDGEVYRHIRERLRLPPGITHYGVAAHADALGLLQRPQNVGRVAAAGECQQ